MKRAARVARFAITSSLATILVILILRGRDPMFASFYQRSPAEIALDRVIGPVEVRKVPFHQAIDDLSRKAGIKIEISDDLSSAAGYYHEIDLTGTDPITLGEALTELITQSAGIACVPDGDCVRIVSVDMRDADSSQLHDSSCVDEYAFSDFMPRRMSAEPAGIFSPSISWASLLGGYGGASDAVALLMGRNDSEVALSPPYLFVVQPEAQHQRLRKIIEALAPGALPRSWYVLPRGTRVVDVVDRQLRLRAVFTGYPVLDRVIPSVQIPRQTARAALKALADRTGVKIVLDLFPAVMGFDRQVSLDGNQMTVALAIRRLLGEPNAGPADVSMTESAIWITLPSGAPSLTLYDLRPWFKNLQAKDRESAAGALIATVPINYHVNFSATPVETVCYFGSILVVQAPADEQKTVADRILKIVNSWSEPRHAANGR